MGHYDQGCRGALRGVVVLRTSPKAQTGPRNLDGGDQVAEDGEENDQFVAAGGA